MEKEKLSFEEKLEKLDTIVKDLEKGEIPLDKAIVYFNEATELANSCNKTLEEATETVNKVLSKDGEFLKLDN